MRRYENPDSELCPMALSIACCVNNESQGSCNCYFYYLLALALTSNFFVIFCVVCVTHV